MHVQRRDAQIKSGAMFATFFPSQVDQLQDASVIALIRSIERVAIATPLTRQPIVTAYVTPFSMPIPPGEDCFACWQKL